jgi:bifunctional non-homologous end joining protein LigD
MAKRSSPAAKTKKAKPAPKPRSLATYQAKRDFTKTSEPSGQGPTKKKPTAKLLFCVQKHLASHLHYDFRLEHRGVLLSWAVPKGPSVNPADKRLAMRVEDHPLDYRTFEGVIPEGYGAGVVMLWDEGTWEPEPGFEDVEADLRKGEIKFTLHGKKLTGSWVIVRTGKPTADGRRENWLLIKHRDDSAKAIDIAATKPNSVSSGLNFEDILRNHPDVWESHKADSGNEGQLAKVVEAVVALKEKPSDKKTSRKK